LKTTSEVKFSVLIVKFTKLTALVFVE